jgi:hypothetical protein
MSEAPRMNELRETALRYAELASQRLCVERTIPAEYKELSPELKEWIFARQLWVHFLFPNLTDAERRILVAMKLQNHNLGLAFRANIVLPQSTEKEEMERATDKLEIAYVQTKALVAESGLREKMSPVQLAILEEDFFKVPFAG